VVRGTPKGSRSAPAAARCERLALMGRSGETRQVQVALNGSQYRDLVRAVPVKAAIARLHFAIGAVA
jgi:hypothetical protein